LILTATGGIFRAVPGLCWAASQDGSIVAKPKAVSKPQHPFDGDVDYLGRQVTVDFFDCNKALLNDPVRIQKLMEGAAKAAKATVVKSLFHSFNPYGVSGVLVISESHLAIHTWPEYGFASIDVFTCGPVVDPRICQRFLAKALKSSHSEYHEFKRGVLRIEGLSHKAVPVQGMVESVKAGPASGITGHVSKGGPAKRKAQHRAPAKRRRP
jgi:S-adenosylmethionine decarboxylase proenzyme